MSTITAIVFDIETGPLPFKQIEWAYTPPEPIADFDPQAVKTGNLGPEKAAEKIHKERTKWAAAKAGESATMNAHKQAFIDKAALSAMTGQILAIGYKGTNGSRIASNDETSILEDFWSGQRQARHKGIKWIGHNIFGFDLPFIIQRSWYHNLAVPQEIIDECNRYRSKLFVDTMHDWSLGQRSQFVKLDALAKFFGIPGKPDDITGADFARLFHGTNEERTQALDYLHNDLEMTWAVTQRLGLV